MAAARRWISAGVSRIMPLGGAAMPSWVGFVAWQETQRAFQCGTFRVYTSEDVVGVEVGGAVKNVIAIACGMAEGMGFGHNTRAAIITAG